MRVGAKGCPETHCSHPEGPGQLPQQPGKSGVGSEVIAVCPLATQVGGGLRVEAISTEILKQPPHLGLRFALWKWGICICTKV